MSYREHLPLPGLQDYLARVWTCTVLPSKQHTVLPDGCIDLVFRLGSSPSLFWVGPMTRAQAVACSEPQTYLGLRFRPGVAPSFLGQPACALVDVDLPLNDSRLVESLFRAQSDSERQKLLQCALTTSPRDTIDTTIVRAAHDILTGDYGRPISQIAQKFGLSDRQFHRRFLHSLGYGPKTLCRIARLRAAKSAAKRGLRRASLATAVGYYDQAHFCHELQEFGLLSSNFTAS